jgi:hypothetical protein
MLAERAFFAWSRSDYKAGTGERYDFIMANAIYFLAPKLNESTVSRATVETSRLCHALAIGEYPRLLAARRGHLLNFVGDCSVSGSPRSDDVVSS